MIPGIPGIEVLVHGIEGLEEVVAVLALGGVIVGLFLAIIVLVILVIAKVASMLRLDSHEYTVDMPVEEAKRKLSDLLRFRGLSVAEMGDQIVVDDIVRVVLSVRGSGSGSSRIFYYAEPKTWLVIAAVILLAVNVALGLAVGIIAYIKYDDTRRAVRAALSELGARQVY